MNSISSPTMKTSGAPLLAATMTSGSIAAAASVDDLIGRITSKDNAVRGPAWQGAAPYGAAAIKPLAAVTSDPDFETARSAKRALWVIVRHAGRPGAAKEANAVAKELAALLPGGTTALRHEALWMLSEIGGDDAIARIAALLADAEVRNDALAALQRLPGRKATAAIKSAFGAAPEDFKYALADALRKRGESVKGFPSQKLGPSRATLVTPPASAS